MPYSHIHLFNSKSIITKLQNKCFTRYKQIIKISTSLFLKLLKNSNYIPIYQQFNIYHHFYFFMNFFHLFFVILQLKKSKNGRSKRCLVVGH